MLPATWRVALDPGTRRIDDGTVLVGGAPLRILRLSAAGARFVDRLVAGAPLGAGGGGQRLVRRLLDAGMAHPRPDGACCTPGDVTAVVPVRDHAGALEVTLAQLGTRGATIVVDDGSRGDAVAGIASDAGAEVIRHETNRGPAAARNSGWQHATSDLIAFVDADCEPVEGWLDALLPHFDDPAVAAAAPRIVGLPAIGLRRDLAAYEKARPSLDRGPLEASVRLHSRVPFVPTAAIVIRRSALEAVNGFDEDMRVGEDVDLVWRLARAGWTVRYEPRSIVGHPARPTATSWLRQRFAYGTSAAPLARRHGAAVAPLSVSPWTAASWALIGSGAPATGVAVAAVTAGLLAPRLRGLQHPWREAARLAGLGHLYGGRAVADAVRRAWWPIAVVAALRCRRARGGVALAMVLPPLLEWRAQRPALFPARWTALRLIDDFAYGAGVWVGCLRERSFVALRPDLVSWPGRQEAVEAPT